MRGLTKKQKNALEKAIADYKRANGKMPFLATELPEYDAIEAMNDYETFCFDALRYVSDICMEVRFVKSNRLTDL